MVLVTGGTGSLGRALARYLLTQPIRALRVISRDEFKVATFQAAFPDHRVKALIGDVRDVDRLQLAFNGADVVIHAAALKRIDLGEREPFEFIRTNVDGTRNAIQAALDCGVERFMNISSDKACASVSTYGSTKHLAECLTTAANTVVGSRPTRYASARYGNVAGSRGSLIPLLMEQRKTGVVTLTDPVMTRFHMLMSEAVRFVISSIEQMQGAELFIPKPPSVRISDVVEAIAPDAEVRIIGTRGLEKMHEQLISFDESRSCEDAGDRYIVRTGTVWDSPSFTFTSDQNRFLTVEEIRAQAETAMAEAA